MNDIPFFVYKSKNIFYNIRKANNQNVVVFVHGSGGNSGVWESQLKMSLKYNLVALDLPSHALSDKFPQLTLNLYVDVVKQLIEELNFRNVVLCGHSLGGAVIQSYYFSYPSDVSALILVGTGGRLRVSPDILNSLKNNYQEFLNGLPSGAFFRGTSMEIVDKYVEQSSKIDPEVTYEDFSICDNFDTLDKTSSITVPCLILVGSDDRLTPVKYSEFFNKMLMNSELNIIPNAGHMVMVEKPNEFNQIVESFMKKWDM